MFPIFVNHPEMINLRTAPKIPPIPTAKYFKLHPTFTLHIYSGQADIELNNAGTLFDENKKVLVLISVYSFINLAKLFLDTFTERKSDAKNRPSRKTVR